MESSCQFEISLLLLEIERELKLKEFETGGREFEAQV